MSRVPILITGPAKARLDRGLCPVHGCALGQVGLHTGGASTWAMSHGRLPASPRDRAALGPGAISRCTRGDCDVEVLHDAEGIARLAYHAGPKPGADPGGAA